MFYPYVETSRLYGFDHPWPEIARLLPRLASYLFAPDASILWHFPWSGFDTLPMPDEHRLFIGIAPLLTIALAVLLRLRRRTWLGPPFASTALAIVLLVALTLSVEGWSLYRVIIELPGTSAVRAVTRLVLVLLFPASMLFAASVDAVSRARLSGRLRAGLALSIAALLLLECGAIRPTTSLGSEWRARLDAAAAALPAALPEAPILLLGPRAAEPSYLRELDGMLLAQERGWASLNGYSGNLPPAHLLTGDCADAAAALSAALDIRGESGTEPFAALARRVVPVGYDACDPSWAEHRLTQTHFAGPLPPSVMAGTSVAIRDLRLRDGAPVAVLEIANRSDQAIPAMSTTQTPVLIAARYVAPATATSEVLRGPGWLLRQALDSDVPPGGSVRVTVPLPPPPMGGPYLIAATLVQHDVGWFDDNGMAMAMSDQTIERDGSLHTHDFRVRRTGS